MIQQVTLSFFLPRVNVCCAGHFRMQMLKAQHEQYLR